METIPNCKELITTLLPPSPPFCEKNFSLVLSEFYHRCALYTPWEQAIDDDKNNLFYMLMEQICSATAFIPHVLVEDNEMSIIWRPYEKLPVIANNINSNITNENRNKFDLLACNYLNEWVRHKFRIFRNKLVCHKDEKYCKLLNLFFMGIKVDITASFWRSIPDIIDRWLSALYIDFSAQYEINIKDELHGFNISMNYKINESDKIPISQCRDKEILRALFALSNFLPEIKGLINYKTVLLSEKSLIRFIDSSSALLKHLGITINLPKSLARELKPRLVVKPLDTGDSKQTGSLVSYLGLETLQKFEWQIAIGEEVLTAEEFKKLLSEKRPIVSFKNGYVKIEPEELSYLLKRAKDVPPTVNDFLQAHFNGDSVLAFDVQEKIDNLFREHEFAVPETLNAKLRPYQKRGFNWICSLLYSGFGCILADDMGLGKTVQSIAVLLRLKEDGLVSGGCFVIAPAALINNWEKELARFAPTLRVKRYHGKGRRIDKTHDIFLTTYQTSARDLYKLRQEAFSVLLVDEAHLMKNTETRISRAVKQLHSKYRLALSGTPVENRLEDLRSLFDFILPGYLGDAAKFKEQYRVPIEVKRDKEKACELQRITAPFLLRRTKTDKTIIQDLPEKIVCNEYAVLEKEQAALYQIVVADSIKRAGNADGKIKSNIILSLLTSLKQICDHPRVFDKASPAVAKLSGKAKLLIQLLREIINNGEKTLIFSQYVETLECLKIIIKKELKEEPLLYHGGLNQETRADIVSSFQNDPKARIMLISLRAGGLGLNLTAASRVIHYDLWYNPAVENQATDRAFRIGQKRTVFVHRLITRNSFEEKVDAMITSKQELADMTITSGESWITKMSHEELKELFERNN